MTNAIVYVNPDRLMPNAAICIQYCLGLGYNVVGVCRGTWDEVIKMNRAGTAEVVVVADYEDLPPGRTPRVEIVSHMPAVAPADGTARAKPGRGNERTVIRRRTGAT